MFIVNISNINEIKFRLYLSQKLDLRCELPQDYIRSQIIRIYISIRL